MEEYLQFAKRVAKNAGEILLKEYGKANLINIIDEENKGIITNVDLLSDRYIREEIIATYPEHSILSEESIAVEGNQYEWVIDPLDGTNNYYRGNPTFSVSICLRKKSNGLIGVVYAPVFNEMYFASSGNGAFLERDRNIMPIHVSGSASINMYTFSFAAGIDFSNPDSCDRIIERIRRSKLFQNFRRRMLESAAYELCCVAKGSFDAHFNNFALPWDISAGEVIVKEAGGNFTYFLEQDIKEQVILASNGVAHKELVHIIEEALHQN